MFATVHITKMFIGEQDPRRDGRIKGSIYPDGHVLIYQGQNEFLTMLRAYNQQKGEQFTEFMANHPEGFVVIEVDRQETPYSGPRIPRALSVSTNLLWVDYDTYRHRLLIYKIKRKEFETLAELELRRVAESTLLHDLDISACPPNMLMTTTDGNGAMSWPFNLVDELIA